LSSITQNKDSKLREDTRPVTIKPTKPTFIVYSPTTINKNHSLKIEISTETTKDNLREHLNTTLKPVKPTFLNYSPTPKMKTKNPSGDTDRDKFKSTNASFIKYFGSQTNALKNKYEITSIPNNVQFNTMLQPIITTAKTSVAKIILSTSNTVSTSRNSSTSKTSSTFKPVSTSSTVSTTQPPIFKVLTTPGITVTKVKPSDIIRSNQTEVLRSSDGIGSKLITHITEESVKFNRTKMIQDSSVNQDVRNFHETKTADSKNLNSTKEEDENRTLDSSSNFFKTISNFLLRDQETEIALSNENQKLKFVLTKEKVLDFLRLFSGLKFKNR
jgi:hypothetical protein